jgi:ribonucleotide reductase alpha subunit
MTISRLWFMPATPVLSNGGTGRGLPISCYLNTVEDSLEGIVNTWNENVWLASRGGGIGTYWGKVRGIGENVGLNGKTSGIIPFVRVMDSLTLAISRARCAVVRRPAISTCRTRRSRSSSKSARPAATSTARRSTCTTACC